MSAKAASDLLFQTLLKLDVSHPPAQWGGSAWFPGFERFDPETRLEGLGFFPGGDGLWKAPGATIPMDDGPKPIMVLGNNFGTRGYLDRLVLEENRNIGTWAGISDLFSKAEVPLGQCFFTNALPSLLSGDGGNKVDILPRRLEPVYLKAARDFLALQIRTLRPRIILTLGKVSPCMLGDGLLEQSGWGRMLDQRTGQLGGYARLDRAGLASVHQLPFEGLAHPISLCALLHPSDRRRNLRHRALPASMTSSDPEVDLLRSALDQGLSQ